MNFLNYSSDCIVTCVKYNGTIDYDKIFQDWAISNWYLSIPLAIIISYISYRLFSMIPKSKY